MEENLLEVIVDEIIGLVAVVPATFVQRLFVKVMYMLVKKVSLCFDFHRTQEVKDHVSIFLIFLGHLGVFEKAFHFHKLVNR
jgi:hypothetical protein